MPTKKSAQKLNFPIGFVIGVIMAVLGLLGYFKFNSDKSKSPPENFHPTYECEQQHCNPKYAHCGDPCFTETSFDEECLTQCSRQLRTCYGECDTNWHRCLNEKPHGTCDRFWEYYD